MNKDRVEQTPPEPKAAPKSRPGKLGVTCGPSDSDNDV